MERETERFLDAIVSSLGRIIACLDGLSEADARWSPSAPKANSLLVIANHTLANAERNVLATFAGEPYDWDRDAEFLAESVTPLQLRASFANLSGRMRAALEASPAADLVSERSHPRLGAVPGREVLLQAAHHAAEHVGEAELTRALLLAREA